MSIRAAAPPLKAFISDLRWGVGRELRFEPVTGLRRSGEQRSSPLARPGRQRGGRRNGRYRVGSQHGALPPLVGGVTSRALMSELSEPSRNARGLSSQCLHCIAGGWARPHRTRGALGVQAAWGPAETTLSKCPNQKLPFPSTMLLDLARLCRPYCLASSPHRRKTGLFHSKGGREQLSSSHPITHLDALAQAASCQVDGDILIDAISTGRPGRMAPEFSFFRHQGRPANRPLDRLTSCSRKLYWARCAP